MLDKYYYGELVKYKPEFEYTCFHKEPETLEVTGINYSKEKFGEGIFEEKEKDFIYVDITY